MLAETKLSHLLEVGEDSGKVPYFAILTTTRLGRQPTFPHQVRSFTAGTTVLAALSDEVLTETIKQMGEIVEAQRPFTDDMISKLPLSDMEQQIEDLRGFHFLEKVWLPRGASPGPRRDKAIPRYRSAAHNG